MFKICLENRIVRKENKYKCYLCHHEFPKDNFDSVLDHVLLDQHKKRFNEIDEVRKSTESEKLLTISESQRRKIVENDIHFDKEINRFRCRRCKCLLTGLSNTIEHIKNDHNKINFIDVPQIKFSSKNYNLKEITKLKTSSKNQTSNPDAKLEKYIIFDSKMNFYKCSLCNCQISNLSIVPQHIQGLRHQKNLMTSGVRNSKNFKNKSKNKLLKTYNVKSEQYISFNIKKNIYECLICNCTIFCENSISEHLKGYRHKMSLKKGRVVNSNEVSKVINSQLISDGCISFNSKANIFICLICNCNITPNLVSEHINGYLHKAKLKSKDTYELNNNNSTEIIGTQISKPQSYFIKTKYCVQCQIHLINTTMLQCHVMCHVNLETNISSENDIIIFDSKENKLFIKCLLCNLLFVSEEQFCKHMQEGQHQNGLKLFSNVTFYSIMMNCSVETENIQETLESPNYQLYKDTRNALYCTLCNISILKNQEKEHNNGKKHLQNMLHHLQTKTSKNNEMESQIVDQNCYVCFMCEQSFCQILMLLNHFKTYEHIFKRKFFNEVMKCPDLEIINLKEKVKVKCICCHSFLYNFGVAIQHIRGKKHKNNKELALQNRNIQLNNNPEIYTETIDTAICKPNVQKLILNIMNEKSDKLTSSEELDINLPSISSIFKSDKSTDDFLNNLMNLDLSKSLTTSKNVKTPNKKLKNNLSFQQNLLSCGKIFIERCIDSGEDNIYNINPEKMHLLELGVSLSFPWKSGRICLPCGTHFQDDKQIFFEHLQDDQHIQCLKMMEKNDEAFKAFPDQFSDLKLAMSYMDESQNSKNYIKCFVCDTEIKNKNNIISSHIKDADHIVKSSHWTKLSKEIYLEFSTVLQNIWYYAQVFLCEFCKKRFNCEIEFVMHLEDNKHLQKVKKLELKKINMKFDSCPTCITYWFAKSDFKNRHYKDPFHKRFVKNGDLVVPEMTKIAIDFLNNAEEIADHLIADSDKVLSQKEKEFELLSAIKETVKSVYPRAQAYIFGSRLSQLGFLDSDVDIFLDCDDVCYKSATQEKSQEYLLSIKEYFINQPDIWIIDELILVTRVPIIKLRHIPTGLKCDISFINRLSVEKSQLIRFYNVAFPICRKLILYLKKWLVFCHIFGSEYISTYAISWYVIFYLQIKGILPTVHELIKQSDKLKIVDGWECSSTNVTVEKHVHRSNFLKYLEELFNYYANFDYQKNIVCPYLGKIIEKRTFAYTDELPHEINMYKNNLRYNELNIFRYDSPMCIQDPVDLSQNITKAVKKQQLRCFKQYCNESAKIISNSKKN